jgi:hypothetical protein
MRDGGDIGGAGKVNRVGCGGGRGDATGIGIGCGNDSGCVGRNGDCSGKLWRKLLPMEVIVVGGGGGGGGRGIGGISGISGIGGIAIGMGGIDVDDAV